MKIRVGDVLRVSATPGTASGYADYVRLTKGIHRAGADSRKGIWGYKEIRDRDGIRRRPAVLLHTNPLQAGSDLNPWFDIVDSDDGYALYHGDNRTVGRGPLASRGNRLLAEVYPTYFDPQKRALAPPILVFDQVLREGRRKGFRRFAGYGVIQSIRFQSQASAMSEVFSNLVLELVLFGLDAECEWFDWEWIDRRRDPECSVAEALSHAPRAWQEWVSHGDSRRSRRHVLRRKIVKLREQKALSDDEFHILDRVYSYYRDNRHCFEGLASLVAARVLGDHSQRGWVTKRSGDGGVDFVSRLDVGSELAQTSAVVLGQAKCLPPTSSVGGRDLARVAARLRRGWIGVFVTTAAVSELAQAEVYEDEYPIVLINGKCMAREIRKILAAEGISVEELLIARRRMVCN